MDKVGYVHRQKKRYMAQILELFEETIEPHVPPGDAQDFKGHLRGKLNALALDAQDMLNLKPGEDVNALTLELRNRLSANGVRS